jgi:hypothetical protein
LVGGHPLASRQVRVTRRAARSSRIGLLDTLSLQFQPATAGLGRRLMSHRDDRRRDIVTALAILACLIVAALLAVFRP